MKIKTTRFGEVDVPDNEVYSFPEGVLGFGDIRSFVLLHNPSGGPFRWLQSAEIPTLAFVVTDPTLFFKDYRVGIRQEEMESIGLADLAKGVVLVILTVPKNLREITANLQGPVILNPAKRTGKQIVLPDPNYSTRQRLFPEETEKPEEKKES